jgi:hypothetical protein
MDMNPSPETTPGIGLNIPSIDFSSFFHTVSTTVARDYPGFVVGLKHFVGFLIGFSIPLSIFFLIVIIYCVEGLKKIRIKEAEIYDAKVEPAYEDVPQAGDAALSKRWDSVASHLSSPNPNDWKQAISDADIILGDILTKLGYQGESIGEKLQRAVRGDFKTLDDAWEAHKVRNQIAHEAGFQLTHHEATQTINKYKKVFEEFYFI